ncbi:MAG: AMP-binding protein [Candidatus Rokubacteria bacterium]|nr:AMP-binding protein [Candidatus Rokubacteria bacterium]
MAEPRHALPDTLLELMRWRQRTTPDTSYFTVFGNEISYTQLWQSSLAYAGSLARAGVGQGDKVCLVFPTCAEFFYTFFGILHLGAVPVPLYPTLGIDATANIFRNCDATVVVAFDWFRESVEASRAGAANIKCLLLASDLEGGEPPRALPTARAEDVAFIQYTSGSTSQPRGVVLSHYNVLATMKFMAEAAGITARDTVVSWLPLYHDMGLIGCSFTPPLVGARLILLPPDLRNPREWLETITRERATFTVSPDFGYRNCVRNVKDTAGLDLSTLKMALSGAEPVRLGTIRAFEDKFGLKNIAAPCYGLAEATLAVAIWPRGEPVRLDPSGRHLSVGRPCTGVSVKIADGETDLPAGREGEILVKSPGLMQGYYNNPELTRQVLLPDGWLRTGDLGIVDAQGYLYITGRIKDVIIIGGENIGPADVEELVDEVAGVRYSAAIGIDSERLGTQRLYVVAEVRDPNTDHEGFSHLAREIVQRVHLGRGHRPARVLLVKPQTIPKTSSGKIQRSRLAQMIAAGELKEQILHATGLHSEGGKRPHPGPGPGYPEPPPEVARA